MEEYENNNQYKRTANPLPDTVSQTVARPPVPQKKEWPGLLFFLPPFELLASSRLPASVLRPRALPLGLPNLSAQFRLQ